jgi:uncharacterized protein GlcG (DUF336 family)
MSVSKFRPLQLAAGAAIVLCLVAMSPAGAWECDGLPSYAQLKAALIAARDASNGGFNLDMWGTIVDRDGQVCAVAFTGENRGSQWPGSRVISAQKAYTANAFSLPGLALSTADLYSAVQPGGSLYGLATSNPIDPALAYLGPATSFGQSFDPLVGYRIGGINVFGGGLALYSKGGTLIGGIGVSGDSSCADHNIAWRTRNNLHLDYVPGGVGPDSKRPDNIVFDITPQPGQMPGDSASGWGHPYCSSVSTAQATELAIATALPAVE